MSKNNERACFGWACFFLPQNHSKKEIFQRLSNERLVADEEIALGRLDSKNNFWEHDKQEGFIFAWKTVLLDVAINDTDFSRTFLSEEEHKKAEDLFRRKQCDHQVIQKLLGKIYFLLSYYDGFHIEDTLSARFEKELEKFYEKKACKEFAPLKKRVDEITAGVKNVCYLQKINFPYGDFNLKDELAAYIKERYRYDIGSVRCFSTNEAFNKFLQKMLLDDEELWKKHPNFNVVYFFNSVYKENDQRHAEKLLDFVFGNIIKLPYGKEIIENNLDFSFLNKRAYIKCVESKTVEYLFAICESKYFEKGKNACSFCYPLSMESDSREKIEKGERYLKEVLFKELYEANAEKAWKWCYDSCASEEPVKIYNTDLRFKDYLECASFMYRNPELKSAFSIYNKEYFSQENVWGRLCLKAYAISFAVENEKKAAAVFYERFYTFLTICEKSLQMQSSYKRNLAVRENIFQGLREKLRAFGVEIAEQNKNDYVISMLDRKVATLQETERFPVLEQLGDAVYGLAVAELRFFDIERFKKAYEEEKNEEKKFDDWVCAATQIKIAKKYGLDKLYFSANPTVNAYSITPEEDYGYSKEKSENYYADALEMLLGALCKDLGYETAIKVCKRMLKESFPQEISEETHWEDRLQLKGSYEKYVLQAYFERILPAPYSYRKHNEVGEIDDALWKFVVTYVCGTETAEKRKFISRNGGYFQHDSTDYITDSFLTSDFYYEYFHYGLTAALERYKTRLLADFEKKIHFVRDLKIV